MRNLLEKLGPSEKSPAVEFLFGNHHADDVRNDVFGVKKENIDMEEDELPLEKKIKLENEELSSGDISILLEGCSDLTEVWSKIKSYHNNIELDSISVKALVNIMAILSSKQIEDKLILEYFITSVTKTMVKNTTCEESYGQFFESFLLAQPQFCHHISSILVIEPNFHSLVIFIINFDLMTNDQERSVLLKWLANFKIETKTMELPEMVLSRNPKLYEDNQVVASLSSSFAGKAAGVVEESDKCTKYAKFLLQVLSKVSSLEEKVSKNFQLVTERNKTFLKKRIEMELNKKSIF